MLTWRSNRDGTLAAAYLGLCRVGYLAASRGEWLWHTSLVRPEGGCYMGRAPARELAVESISAAVAAWVAAAGLSVTEPEKVS